MNKIVELSIALTKIKVTKEEAEEITQKAYDFCECGCRIPEIKIVTEAELRKHFLRRYLNSGHPLSIYLGHYTAEDHLIQLVSTFRGDSIETLLHEIVHSIGIHNHGLEFHKKLHDLYLWYEKEYMNNEEAPKQTEISCGESPGRNSFPTEGLCS